MNKIIHKMLFWLSVLGILNLSLKTRANEPFTFSPDKFNNIISIPDTTATDSTLVGKKWKSSDTYISGSVSWKNDNGNKKVDYDFRFGMNLKNKLNEVNLKVDSRYVSKKNSPNDNEQNFRINWYRKLYHSLYIAGQGRLERNQKIIESLWVDYAILMGGIGPSYLFKAKKVGRSRFSILYNYIQVFIIKSNIETHIWPPSVYIDNDYQLTKKLNLKNWTKVIFYAKDDVGYDMETELAYSITKNLAIGLRHYYLLNGPTLQQNNTNELKIYTKITF